MACPDETHISKFVARALPVTAAARIEAHLADCDDCRNLVFALASSGDASSTERPAAERIGRFEVLDVIGRGAMGIVYRARDPELDRVVAIKVRRTKAKLDVEGEDRLKREAQALARLMHPNVVAVYETGRHDGMAYVAMEYVEGATLDVWLATSPSRDDVLDVLASAGRGLAAAHTAGLVHRDFKPHNVFVSTGASAVKVGDFGLVRTERADNADTASGEAALTLSISGSIIGTPAYMAPEQLRGEPATEASDQFSFCVTLYEALYGKRPFDAKTVDAMSAAMTKPVELPAAPRVSRGVRAALRGGLDHDPGRRFPSMTALLATLAKRTVKKRWIAAATLVVIGTVTAGALASSEPPDPCIAREPDYERVFAIDRTSSIAKAFAATGARNAEAIANRVSGLIGSYGKRWQAASFTTCRATTSRRQSPELGDRQRACLERRLQHANELGNVLASVTDPAVVLKATTAVLALPDIDGCTRADTAMLANHEPPPAAKATDVRRVEAQLDRIGSQHKLGQVAALDTTIDGVVKDARAIGHAPLLARALTVQAIVYSATNRYAELEAILEEAAREAAKARDDRLAAEAWTRRVYAVGVHFARYDDAHKWASAADAAVLRAGNPPDLRASLQMNVATLLIERGKLDEAKPELEAALALRTQHLPHDKIGIGNIHNNLAALLQRQGKFDEAQKHFEHALELFRSVHGEEHPDVFEMYVNLGFLFTDREMPKEALAYLEKAKTLGEMMLGPDHVNVGIALDTMGLARVSLGEYAEAAKLHRKAYEIMLAKLGSKHPRTGYAMANVARASMRLGDYPASIKAYRDATIILSDALGPKHALVARIQIGLGSVLMLVNDQVAAKQAFDAALAIFDANGTPQGEEASMARTNIGVAALQRNRIGDARKQFAQSYPALIKAVGPANPHTLTAQAGLLYCDAKERKVKREQIVAFEETRAKATTPFEPHTEAFLEYARAVAYEAIGDKDQAREVAVLSEALFAKAKLEPQRLLVERMLKGLK